MIVVDASAMIELLFRAAEREDLVERVVRRGGVIVAPHLIDLEVAQVVRRAVGSGQMSEQRGREALDDFGQIRIARRSHRPLLDRIWELRSNLTAYDAAYIALGEALGCSVVTCDRKLAEAPGHGARVEVFA